MSHSHFDEPDEPDYSEPETSAEPPKDDVPAGTVQVTVGRNEIVRLVAERYYANLCSDYGSSRDLSASVEKTLTKMVKKAAEERIAAITDAAIQAAIGDMLENGWSKTNQYGEPAGKVTVKQLVVERLTRDKDNYNRKTRIDELTDELFNTSLKNEIQPLLDKAKAHLKSLLDKTVGESLKKALLEGAGLKA